MFLALNKQREHIHPLIEITLEKYSGKQVSVAQALGINRNTLKRKIDAMKIEIKKINPNKPLTANHTYTDAGVYIINLKGTNNYVLL